MSTHTTCVMVALESAMYSLHTHNLRKHMAADTWVTHLCRVAHSSHGCKHGVLEEGRGHKVCCMQALLLAPALGAAQASWLLAHAHTRLKQR